MSADPATETAGELVPAAQAPPPGAPTPPPRPFRRQFLAVYGLLGLVLGGAAVGTVALVTDEGRTRSTRAAVGAPPAPATPSGSWSSWQPTSSELERPTEIAAHVAPTYRLPSGNQLINVSPFPPRFQGAPISAVVVNAAAGDDTPPRYLPYEQGVVYVLCGELENCAIKEGTPSLARGRLVRREAIELALYTLKYMETATFVVAIFPPSSKAAQGPEAALFWERSDLARELAGPLARTIAEKPPELFRMAPAEAKIVDTLADGHTFVFQGLRQAQDGSAEIVLQVPAESDGG